MTENVENLILTQLREIRGDIAAMRSDMAAMKTDMSQVDQKVGGLTVMLALLAGHVHHVEERVEQLEEGRK
ncbi:MAG: hypothetical protein HZT43_07945 [Exiguobacterium profundum]|nr:MAG: hypothetical protein HZT43_07945 [Exiguobacterium profundum]